MKSWLRKNLKTLTLVASLVLNVLGGTGLIPPPLAGAIGGVINAAGK